MAKVGSRRTGGAGIDLSTVTGILRYVSGQDPTTIDYASQAQAEAGTDGAALMTPLRVKQAITALGVPQFPYKLNESSAPTASDNASTNGDDGRALQVGSLWQHVKVDPPVTEDDVDWYRLEAFAANGDAIWAPAEQVSASVLNTFSSQISTLQSGVTTLNSQMASERSRTFESSGIITVAAGPDVSIELPSVPNDNSVRVAGQSSAQQGLFPFVEDEDFVIDGNRLVFRFVNGASAGQASVDVGDKLDIDWFTDLARPTAVSTPSIDATNVSWSTVNDAVFEYEIQRCPAASDVHNPANWTAVGTAAGTASNRAHGGSSGDRVRVRVRKVADTTSFGVWTADQTVP